MENKIYNQLFDKIEVSSEKAIEIERNLYQSNNNKTKTRKRIGLKIILPICLVFVLSFATVSAAGVINLNASGVINPNGNIDLKTLFEAAFQYMFFSNKPLEQQELNIIEEGTSVLNEKFQKDGVTITFPAAIRDANYIYLPYIIDLDENFNHEALGAVLSTSFRIGTDENSMSRPLGFYRVSQESDNPYQIKGTYLIMLHDTINKPFLKINFDSTYASDFDSDLACIIPIEAKVINKEIPLNAPINFKGRTINKITYSSLSIYMDGTFEKGSQPLTFNNISLRLKNGDICISRTGGSGRSYTETGVYSLSVPFETPIPIEDMDAIIVTIGDDVLEIPVK